jgi:hypothetical protein
VIREVHPPYVHMSKMETFADGLSDAEANLGRALVFIQRVLSRLDDPGLAAQVQADLRCAAGCVESARIAHQGGLGAGVDAETAAIIAAAISSVLDSPHRLLAVQPAPSRPSLNVWAFEGRTQIFQSHKIR